MSTNITYYDAIARSLAKIDASDMEIRLRFYERARALLADRLGSSEPPLRPAMMAAELAAFDAAIAQVESEYSQRGNAVPHSTLVQHAGQGAPTRDSTVADPPRGSKAHLRLALAAVAAAVVVVLAGLAWWWMPNRDVASPAAHPGPAVAGMDRDKGNNETAVVDVEKLPYFMRRQVVYYRSTHPAGTIVITKSQHFLYVVKSDSAALRYTIALGADCADSGGLYSVARKDEAPASPGIDRTLHLDKAGYRIRGTDLLAAIGQNSPSQGFQLLRDDIADLDERTPLGTRVIVMN
jgi:lipoprotein-anchoring transpeptidase ErfK/SrfK